MDIMQYCKKNRISWDDITVGSIVYDPGFGTGSKVEDYFVIVEEKNEDEFKGMLYYMGNDRQIVKRTFSRRDFEKFNRGDNGALDISKDHDIIQRKMIKKIIEV